MRAVNMHWRGAYTKHTPEHTRANSATQHLSICVSNFISPGFSLHPLSAYLGEPRETQSAEKRPGLVPIILHSGSLQNLAQQHRLQATPKTQRSETLAQQDDKGKRRRSVRGRGLLVTQRAAFRRDYVRSKPTNKAAKVIKSLRAPTPKAAEPSRARSSTHHC